jgi:hypothetical protein
MNYTGNTSAILSWTSGTDTDILPKDSLIDEMQVARDAGFTNITFSQTYATTDGASRTANVSGLEPAFSTFYWRVRTCDDTGASNNCSAYATSSFFRYTTVPAECPACPPCEGGGGGGCTARPGYVVTLIGPAEVKPDSDFNLAINFKGTHDIKELLFDVTGPNGFSCKPEKINDYKADTEQNVLLGCKVSNGAKAGQTELTLRVNAPSGTIVKKSFSITVLGAVCGNDICEADLGETAESCPADCQGAVFYFTQGLFWLLVLIIVIATLTYKLWKKEKQLEEQKHKTLIARILLALGFSD